MKPDARDNDPVEEERLSHLRFLEGMDRINRAVQGANNLEQMMSDVLDAVQAIFESDRAWLLYPCDSEASSWQVPMERTRPEYPGALALGHDPPMDRDLLQVCQILRASPGPVRFGEGTEYPLRGEQSRRFKIKSELAMAVYPRVGKPYVFGLHQCSQVRVWTREEANLFQEIGRRLGDALTSLLMYRNLQESEAKFAEAQRLAHVGYWEHNLVAERISLSDEACQIFGLRQGEYATDLARWRERWLELIDPEDRARTRLAFDESLRGGQLYDVEYRVLRPNGERRIVRSHGDVTRDGSGRPRRIFGTIQDITERRQTERQLSVLDFALNHVREATFLIDENARFRHVNEEACRSLGYAREEMLGFCVSDINLDFPPERWPHHWNNLKMHRSLTFESHHRAKDGRIFPVEVNANYFEYEGQAYDLGLVRDTTERKRAEETIRASEARLRAFVDHATDAFFIHDDRGRIHDVNQQACAGLGYTREEMIGMTPADLDPDVDEAFLTDLRARLATGEILSLERRHRRKDGTTFPVEVRLRPFWEGGRRFSVGLSRDVTDRKQVEQRINRLNRTYAVLSDINQLIMRLLEPQAIIEGACRIAVDRGGFRMAWIGMLDTAARIVRPMSSAGVVDGYLDAVKVDLGTSARAGGPTARALRSGEHEVCNDIEQDPAMQGCREEALRRGYRAFSAFPLRIAGRIAGTFNLYADEPGFFDAEEVRLLDELALDIAFALEGCEREQERQRAIDKLCKSEELFRELAETIQEVFWVTDPTRSRVLYISPAYEKIWGRSCQSLYDGPGSWADAIHADDRERVLHAAATQQVEGGYEEEFRIVRPDGQLRWIRDRAFPVRNAAAHVERIVGVARDITERRQIGEQLRQSQKMDAIGQLAGGVAHDFNNILTLVTMQVELTGMVKNLPEEALEYLQEIRAAAERAADLTRQLLLFSRRQVMQPHELDLNDSVTNIAKMLQRFIGEDVRLQLHLHPRPLVTRADAGMVDQVLLNLAVNARDAMPGGGGLTIVTEEILLDEALARIHPEAGRGRYVSMSVSDTGTGIAPGILPHIFEPFFTTKEPGKGTGLGLATVFGIVKQHHGSIAVDSEPGRGTTFQVILPRSEGPRGAPAYTTGRTRLPGGSETILLVEDEPTVRSATRAILAHHGYRLLEASNGVEALKVWQDHRGSVALLITDLVMPAGVSGHELARRLLADRPDLKIVYTSGYSAEIAGRQLELSPGENFLPKPFQLNELLEVIRRCLDS